MLDRTALACLLASLVACEGGSSDEASFRTLGSPTSVCCASGPRVAGKNASDIWVLFEADGAAEGGVRRYDGTSWIDVAVPVIYADGRMNGTDLATQGAGEAAAWIVGVNETTHESIFVRAHADGTVDDLSEALSAPAVAAVVEPSIVAENGGVFALFLNDPADTGNEQRLYRWNGTTLAPLSQGSYPLGARIVGVAGPNEAYIAVPQSGFVDLIHYNEGIFTPLDESIPTSARVNMAMNSRYDVWFYVNGGEGSGGVRGDGRDFEPFTVLDWASEPNIRGLFITPDRAGGFFLFMGDEERTYYANVRSNGRAEFRGKVADRPASTEDFAKLDDGTVVIYVGDGEWVVGAPR